ncbi:hypothetical protein L7F22_029756 [Adiantum nelumboides]|nr:hypothetical protein [Adiantum nelumboides]
MAASCFFTTSSSSSSSSSSIKELPPVLSSTSCLPLSLQSGRLGRKQNASLRWRPASHGYSSVCVHAVMGIPGPIPASANDPFLSRLAAAASTPVGQAQLAGSSSDKPPLLDVVSNPILMAAPGQAERSAAYNEHKPRRPPPDLPSLLLNGRIVYIGMPTTMRQEEDRHEEQREMVEREERRLVAKAKRAELEGVTRKEES